MYFCILPAAVGLVSQVQFCAGYDYLLGWKYVEDDVLL